MHLCHVYRHVSQYPTVFPLYVTTSAHTNACSGTILPALVVEAMLLHAIFPIIVDLLCMHPFNYVNMPMPFSYQYTISLCMHTTGHVVATWFKPFWCCDCCSNAKVYQFGSHAETHSFGTVWLCISHFMWLPMNTTKHVVEPWLWPFGVHFVLPVHCTSFMICVHFRHQCIYRNVPVCSPCNGSSLHTPMHVMTHWCMPCVVEALIWPFSCFQPL